MTQALDFGLGFQGTAYSLSTFDIMRAVEDERSNYLISYYRDVVPQQFEDNQPGIVGLSITHSSEFVPALTLAKIIKSCSPETHICIGGAAVTQLSKRIQKNKDLWSLFDSLVLGPGEAAFGKLIESLENKTPLERVPNLIYKNKLSIVDSSRTIDFDINNACTPEYPNLRPKSIVPLETSTGCYWGRCAFCYYPKMGLPNIEDSIPDPSLRIRKNDLVQHDIEQLTKKYDPLMISFTDSAIPPARLLLFSQYCNRLNVPFSAFFRFEKEFADLGFCKRLKGNGFVGGQAGLESASQRVNDLIGKGTKLQNIKSAIKNFHKLGLLLHVYAMVGLPGERLDEADATYRFIKKHAKSLKLGWQLYPLYVLENAPLVENMKQFKIIASPLPEHFLVPAMMYQMDSDISQEKSMQLAITYTLKLDSYLGKYRQYCDIETIKVIRLFEYLRRCKTP